MVVASGYHRDAPHSSRSREKRKESERSLSLSTSTFQILKFIPESPRNQSSINPPDFASRPCHQRTSSRGHLKSASHACCSESSHKAESEKDFFSISVPYCCCLEDLLSSVFLTRRSICLEWRESLSQCCSGYLLPQPLRFMFMVTWMTMKKETN